MTPEQLVDEARRVMKNAHAPYSNFMVGAALIGKNGKIYRAANVENASFGLSVCAERAAVFAAVGDGTLDFEALAVATDTDEPTPPCGACRQVLREFISDIPVYLAGRSGDHRVTTLSQLLPDAFAPPNTTERANPA